MLYFFKVLEKQFLIVLGMKPFIFFIQEDLKKILFGFLVADFFEIMDRMNIFPFSSLMVMYVAFIYLKVAIIKQ